MALSLAGVEESQHMGHADFRVGGKIFATLGYPHDGFATVLLSPEDQSILVRKYPRAFAPAAGGWGRAGSTSVHLRDAPLDAMKIALSAARDRRAPARKVGRKTARRELQSAKRGPHT
jgi:hypothetical protein